MEDAGDYIYLILLALTVVSGLFGKKNKKKKIAEKKKPVIDIPKSWEDFDRQFNPEMAKPIAKPVTDPVRTVQKPKPAVRPVNHPSVRPLETISSPEYDSVGYETMSYDSTDDISKMRARKTVSKNITRSISPMHTMIIEEEVAQGKINIELKNPDNAREAFIYSEIFNRKYN